MFSVSYKFMETDAYLLIILSKADLLDILLILVEHVIPCQVVLRCSPYIQTHLYIQI